MSREGIYASTPYARVRVNLPGKGYRTVLLEIVRETEKLIVGYEVDRAGNRRETETATTVSQHLYAMAPGDIRKRTALRMNLIYAELEEVK